MSEENQINSYDMLAYYAKLMREDYVYKQALREWCEARISEWMPLVEHPAFSVKPEGVINEMNLILDQFCKEGES